MKNPLNQSIQDVRAFLKFAQRPYRELTWEELFERAKKYPKCISAMRGQYITSLSIRELIKNPRP